MKHTGVSEERATSLAPLPPGHGITSNRQSVLYRSQDGLGRDSAVRVFARNSGLPLDSSALHAYSQLDHAHLQRIFSTGCLNAGGFYIAAEWLDVDATMTSRWPLPMDVVRQTACQLLAALAFLHNQKLFHQNISPLAVSLLPGRAVFAVSEQMITAVPGSTGGGRCALKDIHDLGLLLLRLAVGCDGECEADQGRLRKALQAVPNSDLRDFIECLLDESASISAEEALVKCSRWIDARRPEALRSCIGRIRWIDPRLVMAYEAAVAELRRGRSSFLFVEGRWGTGRQQMLVDLLDCHGERTLPLAARSISGVLETAAVRLEDAVRRLASAFGGEIATAGAIGKRISRMAQGILERSGRDAVVLSIEIDDDPGSDDTNFLDDLLPYLNGSPVMVLAHSSSTPARLPGEAAVCRLDYPDASALSRRFFLPGRGAVSIMKRLAVEAGGNVELFKDGLHSALLMRGARALDGTWKGGGATILVSSPGHIFDALPETQRHLVTLLLSAESPLPRNLLTDEECECLSSLALLINSDGDQVSLRAETRHALRRTAGLTRAGALSLLARLRDHGSQLAPLTMAMLLMGAGRYANAIMALRETGTARLRFVPRAQAHRLFDRLAPHANRSQDADFWELRGDWATSVELYREGIAAYRRAMSFQIPGGGTIICKYVRAAESATDYRLAVRIAEEAVGEATGSAAVELRCAAARCRYLIGDTEAAGAHWNIAQAFCRRPAVDPLIAGKCLRDYGYFLLRRDDDKKKAREALLDAEKILTQIDGAAAEAAQARHYLGILQKNEGERDKALKSFRVAAGLYAEEGNLLQQGKVASDLGVLYMDQEMWSEARRELETSLSLFRKIRNRRSLTLASFNLAEVMLSTGEYEEAQRLLELCLDADRASGNLRSTAYDLSSLGMVALCKGDVEEARLRLAEASEIFAAQKDRVEMIDTMLKQVRLQLLDNSLDAAASLLDTISAHRQSFPMIPRLVADYEILRGRYEYRKGRFPEAAEAARLALASAHQRPSAESEAELLLAQTFERTGRKRDAHQRYRIALAAARRSSNPFVQADVMLTIIDTMPDEFLKDPAFIEELEEIIERSCNPRLVQRYRTWHEGNAACFGLGPARCFAPPGVESEVFRISRKAGQGTSDESVALLILDAMRERLSAAMCLLVLKKNSGEIAVVAKRGEVRVKEESELGVTRIAIENRNNVVLGELETLRAGMPGIVSAMAVPLFRKGSTIGAIYLDRRAPSEALTHGDAEFVAALADGLALGLRGALSDQTRQKDALFQKHPALGRFIAVSDRMEALLQAACRVAPRDVNVLISGESGTGKEILARSIHDMSGRAKDRFIGVNCSAIPEALLESEFFGYRRGAFTDARSDRAGLIEEADGGTFFLDEIGEMPLRLQAKLLRVVQEREFRRIGETRNRSVDLRFISATNRDLPAEVTAGRFREDLFYRLQVVTLLIPPLRERREDVLPLVDHYLSIFSRNYGLPAPRLGTAARTWILRQRWPGNVRELQNALQRALLAAGDSPVLEREHFEETSKHEAMALSISSMPFADACAHFERDFLIESLRRAGGSRTTCARDLGLSRQGVFKLIKRLGIKDDGP